MTRDLEELDEKIRLMEAKPERRREAGSDVSFGLRLLSEIAAGLAVGVGMGILLDKVFLTKGILTAVFALLGCGAGFRNVYKAAQEKQCQVRSDSSKSS